MKSLTSRTLLSAFLLCSAMNIGIIAGPGTAVAASQKISKGVTSQIMDAQKALQAKDFQGAMAKLKEAQAVSDRTDFDNYIINRLTMSAAVGLNDMATAATAAATRGPVPGRPGWPERD